MSDKEKPLPQPPTTPFGRKKRAGQGEGDTPLIADQLAVAAAQGKLDEYIKQTMPDNEYSKALTMMMMGMSGMMPLGNFAPPPDKDKQPSAPAEQEESPRVGEAAPEPPDDVLRAINSADVKGLTDLLQREYRKINPDAGPIPDTVAPAPPEASPAPGGRQGLEKAVVDQLVAISTENGVTVDWLILRAMKLYAQEYAKTGRL